MKNKKNIVIIISIFVVFFIAGFLFGTPDQKAENKAVFEMPPWLNMNRTAVK